MSKQSGVSQDRIWHLIRSRVEEAWNEADWKSLERLGVDETSTRKGHKYGTAFLEINGRETVRGEGASKVARLLFGAGETLPQDPGGIRGSPTVETATHRLAKPGGATSKLLPTCLPLISG